MLHLVLGRAGSGKTEYARALMEREIGVRRPILIVPEQSSFENERAVLHHLGPQKSQEILVTSFSRLADLAFRQYGGAAGRRLDDGGRGIFMSLALEQVKDNLQFYRKSADSTELVSLMLDASAELKMCAVPPGELKRAADAAGDENLRQKAGELALVLGAYDALVAQSFVDPQDDLTRLRALLQNHDFFRGASVALDSFQSFTVQEYRIIEQIFLQAEELTVTLCADTLDDAEQGMGLFSLVRRTGKNLIRMAKQNGVRVAAPVMLEPGKRFSGRGLARLEEGVFRTSHKAGQEAGDVFLYEGKDAYGEADYVSAAIRNLVREKGYRYRDFAVIVRSTEPYRGVIDTALQRREIPYFMDKPMPVEAEPLMRLILSAFQIVRSGFAPDDLFSYLKTGLAGLSTEEISELENYSFTWKLTGKQWREPWKQHPRGFAGELTPGDEQTLERLNECRARVVQPLLRFAASVRMAEGEAACTAVYRLLQEVDAPGQVRLMADRLNECGRADLAERQLRLWDLLMEILDQAALVLRGISLPHTRMAELLRLIIRSSTIASIPQGLDEVTVGAADRMRPAQPKVVFLMGAAQGDFPMAPGVGAVFSDGERRELIRLGLPLNDTLEGTAVQERFMAYSAMTYASERLYVTCPACGPDGQAKTPSAIVSEIRAVLPQTQALFEAALPPLEFANAAAPAFERAARQWNRGTAFSSTLRAYFQQREEYAPRLQAVARAADQKPAAFQNPRRARELFGGSMQLSATQIEKYHLCRFQYFCRFGLGAKERRAAELDALEYGSLMHFLLENLFGAVGSERINEMTEQELGAEIDRLLLCYVEQKLGGLEEKSPRFLHLFARLSESARVIAAHIARELCQSGFQPVDFELPIGGDGVPPLSIELPDGGRVRIEGQIDRVDLYEKDGVSYVRVVDYKTGKKEFKLSDIVYGVNMQMLIYLAALAENGGARYGRLEPAGVLYMPANRPIVSAPRGTRPEKIQADEDKKLRMNGLLVDDPELLLAMEAKGEGKYIPVALKNGEPARRDSVLSPRELRGVMNHIKGLVRGMACELHAGHIQAEPLTGDYDACAWCPYFPVCGREKDGPAREMKKWDRDEALRELTGGGEEAVCE